MGVTYTHSEITGSQAADIFNLLSHHLYVLINQMSTQELGSDEYVQNGLKVRETCIYLDLLSDLMEMDK